MSGYKEELGSPAPPGHQLTVSSAIIRTVAASPTGDHQSLVGTHGQTVPHGDSTRRRAGEATGDGAGDEDVSDDRSESG